MGKRNSTPSFNSFQLDKNPSCCRSQCPWICSHSNERLINHTDMHIWVNLLKIAFYFLHLIHLLRPRAFNQVDTNQALFARNFFTFPSRSWTSRVKIIRILRFRVSSPRVFQMCIMHKLWVKRVWSPATEWSRVLTWDCWKLALEELLCLGGRKSLGNWSTTLSYRNSSNSGSFERHMIAWPSFYCNCASFLLQISPNVSVPATGKRFQIF